MVREHVTAMVDLIKLAEPEELKRLYSDLFSVVIDLEKQEGQLRLKLASAGDLRQVTLHGNTMVGVRGFEPRAPSAPC